MAKTLSRIGVVIALVFLSMLVGRPAAAFKEIETRERGIVKMTAPEPSTTGVLAGRGRAGFILSRRREGYYDLRIRLRAAGLPPSKRQTYEGWLVDEQTGYALSLGVFAADKRGRGRLDVSMPINDLAAYETIAITAEPKDDTGPGMNGPVVLIGKTT